MDATRAMQRDDLALNPIAFAPMAGSAHSRFQFVPLARRLNGGYVVPRQS